MITILGIDPGYGTIGYGVVRFDNMKFTPVQYLSLIHIWFVQICSRTSVTLTDGTVLPVSRAKAEETQTAFMAYMRSLRP